MKQIAVSLVCALFTLALAPLQAEATDSDTQPSAPKAEAKKTETPTEAQLEELRKLIADGTVTSVDLKVFLAAHRSPTPYRVLVDCDLKAAALRYCLVQDVLKKKNFIEPECRSGPREIVLVSLGHEATTREVLVELERRGLRPATLPELFALRSAYPELQRKFPFVVFGSNWLFRNSFRVPLIDEGNGGRELSLEWVDPKDLWGADFHFAAVRIRKQ